MKEAFEKIKDFLKSKFDYCAEQAGMNLDAECGSEISSYFRERKELYLDRANIYGEVMREIDRIEAEFGKDINVRSNAEEVCEWIKYDYRTITPRNHDADNPYWRIPENMDKLKFCPYCGKKIKVIGLNQKAR